MTASQSGYLLGIGSNIDPENNIRKIISLLINHFPHLTLSRVLTIPPIGMNSQHDFLNLVIFIDTECTEDELKQICNHIEIELGRNRNDPNRKTKDRPADLDILTKITLPDEKSRSSHTFTDEYFLYPLIDEIIAYLTAAPIVLKQLGVEICLDNLTFGQSATTINRNTRTSNKRII